MDITQSVDPRNNIFLELMNMSRNALFAGKNVCMPHAPSVGAGIPWVAHPISKCDTCTLFDHHTSGLYNKDTCHNVTIPPASLCCIPGLPSCNLTSATPIMTDLLMPRIFYWCMENYAPASTTLGEIPRERCSFVIERRTEFNVYVTTSDKKEENALKECLYGNPSLPKLFAINQRQINSHMCALCVTRKHQLSRSSPRSLSAFVPTVSLWQLVRSSLHSVSLSELPFHGGFYPVSTPITTIRHRWSSFCTWPTYLPLSPESFSRCRLRWTTPPSPHAATETVKRCVTCQKNNDVPAATTPAAHTPAPPGPFRHLQVDYISLPPCKWKTDVLVVIDKFSRWVEAYPTGRATAAHTAKCLVTDFIPRWGLPDCIDSDQGTHFTGQVVKEVSRMLKIKWNLHCPYRPQASGQVERSNRTIKTRLSKMHQEGVPWVEALPAVLCSMRASPNRSVGLSPHEIITGRPMQMQGVIDLRNADVHIASDALIAYCENLTKAVQSAKERVESCWQTPPEGGHTIVPGQWVMIKAFKNKPLEPKWYGPHQVMLITAAAVLCQGRKTWTHVSHCKVVPPPAGIG